MFKNKKGDASLFMAIILVILVSITIAVLCNSVATFLLLTRAQEVALQSGEYAELGIQRARFLLDGGYAELQPKFVSSSYSETLIENGVAVDITITYNDPSTPGYDPNFNYTITALSGGKTKTARYSGGFLVSWD